MKIIIDGRPKMVVEALLPEYTSNMTDSSHVEVSVESVAVLQAVADPIRWAVLSMLADEPRCVCKLQEQIPIAGNLLSYHLKTLREAGLVTTSRRGRWIDYALAEDAHDRMRAALPGALATASS
jgi:ArsR family transcriptional regulator